MIDRFRIEERRAADMQDAGEAMGDAKEAIGESDPSAPRSSRRSRSTGCARVLSPWPSR